MTIAGQGGEMPAVGDRASVRASVGWLRAGGVASVVAAAAWLLGAAPAAADCQPNSASAVTGDTVTCSGVDNTGFQANPGVNQLTVNVLSGALVNGLPGRTAI